MLKGDSTVQSPEVQLQLMLQSEEQHSSVLAGIAHSLPHYNLILLNEYCAIIFGTHEKGVVPAVTLLPHFLFSKAAEVLTFPCVVMRQRAVALITVSEHRQPWDTLLAVP
jgi:proteasome lid subunit RPN8/RPN11